MSIQNIFLSYLFLFALTLVGCSQPESLQNFSWRAGDSQKQLAQLQSIEVSATPSTRVLYEEVLIQDQLYKGYRVENSFIKTVKSSSGQYQQVKALVSYDHKNLSRLFKNKPLAATSEMLLQIVKKNSNMQSVKMLKVEPIISFQEQKYQIVWQLDYEDIHGALWMAQFDSSGRLKQQSPVGAVFFDRATVYPMGPKLSDLKDVVFREVGIHPALSNALVNVFSDAVSEFPELQRSLQLNPNDPNFDQLQTYYYADRALLWISEQLGITMNQHLDFQLHVGFPEKTNAAFYYAGKIRLGSGDDVIYSKLPQDPSIVTHEIFHALNEQLARLPYQGEGGSLNEAFADFFAALVLDRPYLGESAYLQGPYKRSLLMLKKWDEKTGGLYNDSLIISGLLWDYRVQFGVEKSKKIALRILSHLDPQSQFADFNRECRAALLDFLTEPERNKALNTLQLRNFPAQ